MGDWRTVVGDKSWQDTVGNVGPHGLGTEKSEVKCSINFCEINGLVTINSWFKKPKRR